MHQKSVFYGEKRRKSVNHGKIRWINGLYGEVRGKIGTHWEIRREGVNTKKSMKKFVLVENTERFTIVARTPSKQKNSLKVVFMNTMSSNTKQAVRSSFFSCVSISSNILFLELWTYKYTFFDLKLEHPASKRDNPKNSQARTQSKQKTRLQVFGLPSQNV